MEGGTEYDLKILDRASELHREMQREDSITSAGARSRTVSESQENRLVESVMSVIGWWDQFCLFIYLLE